MESITKWCALETTDSTTTGNSSGPYGDERDYKDWISFILDPLRPDMADDLTKLAGNDHGDETDEELEFQGHYDDESKARNRQQKCCGSVGGPGITPSTVMNFPASGCQVDGKPCASGGSCPR